MKRQPAAATRSISPEAAIARLFPNISEADTARVGRLVASCYIIDTNTFLALGPHGVRKEIGRAFTKPHATAVRLLPWQHGGISGIAPPVAEWPAQLRALEAAQELEASGAAFRFSVNPKSPANSGPTVAPEFALALRGDAEFVEHASLYAEGSNDPARFRAMQAALFATAVEIVHDYAGAAPYNPA